VGPFVLLRYCDEDVEAHLGEHKQYIILLNPEAKDLSSLTRSDNSRILLLYYLVRDGHQFPVKNHVLTTKLCLCHGKKASEEASA
jgi:hypothetical protein